MSAFKKLFTDMINADGDASKLNKDLSKQMLKVFVKETSPYFLVSDSFFYVPAYFTQAALDEYKKKFANVELTDLNEKVILISNWSLELKRVDSNAVFTSYAGVEVRLVIHSFKPQLTEALHPTRWPTNLYRDDEFKTTIQHFRHRSIQHALASHKSEEQPLHGKGENIVAGKDDWHFKEGTTKVVTLGGAAKKAPAAAAAAPKVKGGASGKRAAKAAGKSAKKSATKAPTSAKTVEKVLKFTPSKKAAAPAKGKKSVTVGKKAALPTPAGKKSSGNTTDKMSMQTFKQFLKAKGGKKSSTVLGKRSAPKVGKKSATAK